MSDLITMGWENEEFPSILDHLQALRSRKESGIVIDSEVQNRFKEWMDTLLLTQLQNHWAQYFGDWYATLVKVVSGKKEIRDIVQRAMAIYEKAGFLDKWPGINVAGQNGVQVFLSYERFVIYQKGAEDLHFPILEKQERESVIRFGQALVKWHPIEGMKQDENEFYEYIKSNNDDSQYLSQCWPGIVARFVQAIKAVRLFDIPQVASSEKLRKHAKKKPIPYALIGTGNVIVYLRANEILVINKVEKQEKSFELENESTPRELAQYLSSLAAVLYENLPLTEDEVRQALFTINTITKTTSRETTGQ